MRKETPATRHRGRAAFSLIELLVVIAIIGILAGLLIPAISSARERARAAKCGSQVRQILLARQMYTGDHFGNMIPNRPPWPADPKGWSTWRWLLKESYSIGEAVFRCPSAPNSYTEAGRGESFATAQSDVKANYAQVSEVFGNDTKSRRESSIPTPSMQLEVFETRDYWPDMNMGSWGWVWADGYGVYGYWHSLRMNAGYGDGHVALKLLSETAAGGCQWDTPAGPHNGANHPEYFYMLSHYK